MTVCETYVGDLDAPPFSWDGGDWNSNCPQAISTLFPPQRSHYNAAFHAFIKEHDLEFRQTDYGCWVARVTRDQIVEFIASTYEGCDDLPWVRETLPKIRQQVVGLNPTKLYALVAREF
jgi:hypothetical protein